MTGALSMGNNKITDVATPIVDTDAVNKGYVDKKPNIITGSYTGARKDGVNNPNTITFPFIPTIVFIYPATETNADDYATYYGVLLPTIGRWGCAANSGPLSVNKETISISNTTVSWYHNNYQSQMNDSLTYYYVAIG